MCRARLLILLAGWMVASFAEETAAASDQYQPSVALTSGSDACLPESKEGESGDFSGGGGGDACRDGCRHSCSLAQWLNLRVSGHLNQGVTVNGRNVTNPPGGYGNLPSAGLPYRANRYMLNQLYLSLERPTDVENGGWDVGARVDLSYGTDYIFQRSRGLETERDFTNKWNGDSGSSFYGRSLYGLAMPQLYAEIACQRLRVRFGHFFSLFGHEELLPTENFFYTNSYALFYNGYGESAPVTGMQVQYDLSEQVLVAGEMHRGSVNWEDNNSRLNAVGLIEWQNMGGDLILCYSLDIGAADDAGDNTVMTHSGIFEWQFAKSSSYLLNASYGFEENVATGGGTGRWYGFANYLAHDVNELWTLGLRYELYDNVDGVRTLRLSTFDQNAPGVYHEITAGLNYKPRCYLTIRPEARWDWFDADAGVESGPFGDGTKRNQFLMAVDMVLSF